MAHQLGAVARCLVGGVGPGGVGEGAVPQGRCGVEQHARFQRLAYGRGGAAEVVALHGGGQIFGSLVEPPDYALHAVVVVGAAGQVALAGIGVVVVVDDGARSVGREYAEVIPRAQKLHLGHPAAAVGRGHLARGTLREDFLKEIDLPQTVVCHMPGQHQGAEI